MMVFQTGSGESERTLSWGDLATGNSTQIGEVGQIFSPRVSPDGTRCVVEVQGEAPLGRDLWMVDLETGQRNRFTFEEGDEVFACWTPDASSILYTSRVEGVDRIMRRPVEGTGGATMLYEASVRLTTTDVHPDGSGVLFSRWLPDTTRLWNLEFLAFDGDGEPTMILPNEGYGGRYSPDARWIAYGGYTAEKWQVFVMPASGGSRKWQITTAGAVWPQWQPDGKRLFVHGYGSKVVACDVDTSGDSFRFSNPVELTNAGDLTPGGVPFAVHPDGNRVVQAGPEFGATGDRISPIHLVTDWRRALAR
jgi:Tol biopolymer transport system component